MYANVLAMHYLNVSRMVAILFILNSGMDIFFQKARIGCQCIGVIWIFFQC
jgi:hypothetical protein